MSIDWTAIRSDYEKGMSLRQLTEKYGVPKSVIGRQKYKEQWDQPRQRDKGTNRNTQDVIHPDMNAAVRAALGFKLRYEEYKTWEEVAAGAGYASRGSARNAVKREAQRHVSQDIEEIREEEFYRLNRLQSRCYAAGMNEQNEDWTWAIDRFEKLSKRKSELMGLDTKPDEITPGVVVVREYGVDTSKV